ncbi:cation-translocating P-type ATPase [Kaarinaea lacus]
MMDNSHVEARWHAISASDVLAKLHVNVESGLDAHTVAEHLTRDGYNEIVEQERHSILNIVIRQFSDLMILILIIAAIISGIIGSPEDAIAILVIVILNALVGASQEYRAEHAIAALKVMAAPEARVLRNGNESTIDAREVVIGDLVYLEAGDVVPVDLRLLEVENLEIEEAALTGESLAVGKNIESLPAPDAPQGDRYNMAYKGTQVSRGRALGVTVATGMATELGKIASLLQQQRAIKTPLQQRLTRFGRRLALIVLAICALIFLVGLLRGEPVMLMFLTAVSLAVAAIPEALPAVVTVSLAIGARKMSHQRALVRNLPAVETLGSVTFICADKTGTLTKNKMQLEKIITATDEYSTFPPDTENQELWQLIGQTLALNNDVRSVITSDANTHLAGDPTELAFYLAARENGFDKTRLEQKLPRVAELPFDSERKRMTTLHRTDKQQLLALVKGAPESLLPICNQQLTMAGKQAIDRDKFVSSANNLAEKGYRVMALAFRNFPTLPELLNDETVEHDLILLGLVALLDPPREEARKAVQECFSAGIAPVMITGDHPGTALSIAARLDMVSDDAEVITGMDLDQMTLTEFERQVEQIRVYARVNPQQKTKIVQALQDKGQFVAMTGDGVNDAPALKAANIGIAMGKKGTEVAREASDMVLLDDNFATIVTAVREGRRVFDNIRKFIKYTMTSNSGEIWTLFLAPLFGMPIPLLPIHILWINLVTDGLPGLALSAEPAERGVMHRSPRPPDESIFAGGMWQHMLWVGLLIGGLSILSMTWALEAGKDNWQTIIFTVLTFSQLMHAIVIRSESQSIFTLGLFSNMHLLAAVVFTVLLQLAVIYLPVLNTIFKTAPLSMQELLVCFIIPSIVFIAVEIEKFVVRRKSSALNML